MGKAEMGKQKAESRNEEGRSLMAKWELPVRIVSLKRPFLFGL
jgi:hypothetical protein